MKCNGKEMFVFRRKQFQYISFSNLFFILNPRMYQMN